MSAICMCQAQGAVKYSWEVGGDGRWPSGAARSDASSC